MLTGSRLVATATGGSACRCLGRVRLAMASIRRLLPEATSLPGGGENCGKENGKRDKMGISCSISACTDVVTQYRSYLQGAGLRPSADGSAVRTSLVAGDG